MSAIINNEQYRLWVHLRQTYDLLSSYEAEKFSKAHITYEQYLVLWAIQYFNSVKKNEPFILTTLASMIGRNMATVSQIVSRMEKKGLVKKNRDLSDHRAIRLVITKKGQSIFLDNAKPNLLLVKHLLSVFSENELNTMLCLIKKLKKRVTDEFGIPQVKQDHEINNRVNVDNFLKELSS